MASMIKDNSLWKTEKGKNETYICFCVHSWRIGKRQKFSLTSIYGAFLSYAFSYLTSRFIFYL